MGFIALIRCANKLGGKGLNSIIIFLIEDNTIIF